MTYNLGTVRGRIEQKLDDTSFGVAKLNQFINDGQRDILNSRRFIFMEREADVTTNEGSQTLLNMPTDMQTPLSLRIHTPVGYATLLPYLEYEDFDRSIPNQSISGNTVPSAWRVFNRDILVYPNPDTAYYLKLKYIKEVTELTLDADVPEIPESFGEALVLAGYKRALEHNDDFDQAQVVQLQIDELTNRMDDRYKRQGSQPHIMRTPNRAVRRRGF